MTEKGAKDLNPATPLLRFVVVVSAIYDAMLGVSMLLLQGPVIDLFGIAPPRYPILGNLNGLFALSIGIGYWCIRKNPQDNLWYIWIMGVFLKATGPLLFVVDGWLRGSPRSFLAFAVTDGLICVLSLWALMSYSTQSKRTT